MLLFVFQLFFVVVELVYNVELVVAILPLLMKITEKSCFSSWADTGSVAKRCGRSLYTILNILAFDFSVLFVGYSLIGNISLTFFVAQRTKRPARE